MSRAILLLALFAACGPSLYAQTAPPPGRTASLDENDGHYDLNLSQGVAIAISCIHDGPCKDVVVSTENEAIADVKGAAFGALEHATYGPQTYTSSGIVVIGKNPGKTKVRVKTAKGSKTINVTVLAPPAAGEHAVVAR